MSKNSSGGIRMGSAPDGWPKYPLDPCGERVAKARSEARDALRAELTAAVEAAYEKHRSRVVEDGTGDQSWHIGSVSEYHAAVLALLSREGGS